MRTVELPLPFCSLGQLAGLLGVPSWRVARLFELRILPEVPRLGRQRAIPRTWIPQVIDALRARGWYPTPAQERQGVHDAK